MSSLPHTFQSGVPGTFCYSVVVVVVTGIVVTLHEHEFMYITYISRNQLKFDTVI